MERRYREMFDEVRSSTRLQEEVSRMTQMERKPARQRLPKKALLAAAVLVVQVLMNLKVIPALWVLKRGKWVRNITVEGSQV